MNLTSKGSFTVNFLLLCIQAVEIKPEFSEILYEGICLLGVW